MSAPASLLVLASAIRDVHETAPLAVTSTALAVPSVANRREHHYAKAKRTAAHRFVGATLGRRVFCGPDAADLPCVVLLTRVAPKPLDNHDNLASAFKGLVDGIADVLGVDDRNPRVTWLYAQRKGPAAVELGVWRRR